MRILLITFLLLASGCEWFRRYAEAKRVDHEQFLLHCKLVREVSGESIPVSGFTSNGHFSFGVATTADKRCYKCTDGVERCYNDGEEP